MRWRAYVCTDDGGGSGNQVQNGSTCEFPPPRATMSPTGALPTSAVGSSGVDYDDDDDDDSRNDNSATLDNVRSVRHRIRP